MTTLNEWIAANRALLNAQWRAEIAAIDDEAAALVADLARARRDGRAMDTHEAIDALVERYGLHVSNAGVARVVGGVWQEVRE